MANERTSFPDRLITESLRPFSLVAQQLTFCTEINQAYDEALLPLQKALRFYPTLDLDRHCSESFSAEQFLLLRESDWCILLNHKH